MQVEIKVAKLDDLKSILETFKASVLEICRNDYSKQELEVWASASKNTERWVNKIQTHFFLVAVVDGKIVGFGSLENQETIDLLYVHKNFNRLGIATEIFNTLVAKAQHHNAKMLKADVSKTARLFFERRGFKVLHEQSNQIRDVTLTNYHMVRGL